MLIIVWIAMVSAKKISILTPLDSLDMGWNHRYCIFGPMVINFNLKELSHFSVQRI
jgi:hypothetical protein